MRDDRAGCARSSAGAEISGGTTVARSGGIDSDTCKCWNVPREELVSASSSICRLVVNVLNKGERGNNDDRFANNSAETVIACCLVCRHRPPGSGGIADGRVDCSLDRPARQPEVRRTGRGDQAPGNGG